MEKKKKWIIVTNKLTYVWLLSIPIGIAKFIYDYQSYTMMETQNIMQLGYDTFVSLIIMTIGVGFFIKFNTYSAWMNPNHPKE